MNLTNEEVSACVCVGAIDARANTRLIYILRLGTNLLKVLRVGTNLLGKLGRIFFLYYTDV